MSDKYTMTVDDSGNSNYSHRVLIGTATTGLVRMEWVAARYGQIIPVNWGQVSLSEFIGGYHPLRYQVDDAQNLIVQEAVKGNYEWLLLWEHDVIPPPNALIKLGKYMDSREHPVVSGLYTTRAVPSDPLVFRGRGTGAYRDWELGDMVWADGVPTGFLLIHASILKLMYDEAPDYLVQGKRPCKQVFRTPRDIAYDPEVQAIHTISGTSDLDWCTRVMADDVLGRAGWKKHAEMPFPFLVDTTLACMHINPNGEQFPNTNWEDFA